MNNSPRHNVGSVADPHWVVDEEHYLKLVADADHFSTEHILLDAHVPGAFGGTGARVDFSLVREFQNQHPKLTLWLAGGLTPENVAEAVTAVRPCVVDVSSGVETTPGRKDFAKMRMFVAAVREAGE
jgi:phosphoribosylanthranilate isomerase